MYCSCVRKSVYLILECKRVIYICKWNIRMTFIEDIRESSLQISVGDYSDPFITHPLQRVEAKWKGDFRFGGKSTRSFKKLLLQLQKAFCFFCFGYFPGYFRQFFYSSDTRRRNITPMDVEVNKICDFTIHQWNLLAISRRFTP